MKAKSNLIRLTALIATLTFINIACSRSGPSKPPVIDRSDDMRERSESITAHIFLDASLSMLGYVTPGSSTRYIQTLDTIESVLNSSWKSADLNFYKFGNKVVQLSKKDEHRNAARSIFYQDSGLNTNTLIDNVINDAYLSVDDSLTIIVTDLFQEDSYVSKVSKLLQDKCFTRNYAIGVVGLRSEFNGTIFDVGPKRISFPYASGKNKNRYRPFYLILLGKHADIAHFMNNMKTSDAFATDIETVIFSYFNAYPIIAIKNTQIKFVDNVVEASFRVAGDLSIESNARHFRVRRNTKAHMVITGEWKRLLHSVAFENKDLETEVTGEYYDAGRSKYIKDEETTAALQVENVQIDSNAILRSALVINSKSLPGDVVYRYNIVIRPSRESYRKDHWWDSWNMPQDKVDLWQKNPIHFDGSKTYNLKLFMDSMMNAVYSVHKPKLARFRCYIKKMN